MGPIREASVQIFERVFPDYRRFEWHMDGECVSAGLEDMVKLIRDLDETIKSNIVINSPPAPRQTNTSCSFLSALWSEQAEEFAAHVKILEEKKAIRKNKFQFEENFLPE